MGVSLLPLPRKCAIILSNMCKNFVTKAKSFLARSRAWIVRIAVNLVKAGASCLSNLLFVVLGIIGIVSTALWWPPCSPILIATHLLSGTEQKWYVEPSDESDQYLIYTHTDNNPENTGVVILATKGDDQYYYGIAAIASIAQPLDPSWPFISVSFDDNETHLKRVIIDPNRRTLLLPELYGPDIYRVSEITFVYRSTTGEEVSTTIDLSGVKPKFDRLLK